MLLGLYIAFFRSWVDTDMWIIKSADDAQREYLSDALKCNWVVGTTWCKKIGAQCMYVGVFALFGLRWATQHATTRKGRVLQRLTMTYFLQCSFACQWWGSKNLLCTATWKIVYNKHRFVIVVELYIWQLEGLVFKSHHVSPWWQRM